MTSYRLPIGRGSKFKIILQKKRPFLPGTDAYGIPRVEEGLMAKEIVPDDIAWVPAKHKPPPDPDPPTEPIVGRPVITITDVKYGGYLQHYSGGEFFYVTVDHATIYYHRAPKGIYRKIQNSIDPAYPGYPNPDPGVPLYETGPANNYAQALRIRRQDPNEEYVYEDSTEYWRIAEGNSIAPYGFHYGNWAEVVLTFPAQYKIPYYDRSNLAFEDMTEL